MKCLHSHSWAWDSSCLQNCHIPSSHKSGSNFFFCEFNRSGTDTFALFPELWVIQCWKWYASCVAMNRKIENWFFIICYYNPCSVVRYFELLNLTKMLSSRIILASSLHENGYEFPVNCFWVLTRAKGKTVAVGKIAEAATYWQLFRYIKPFCISSDILPLFSVDHHVLEYSDGCCQPMEERWTSSPPRKGRNVAGNELSSPAIIYL